MTKPIPHSKYERVKQLYLQHKTNTEIAKLTNISLSTIGKIVLKLNLQSFDLDSFSTRKELLNKYTQEQLLESLATRDYNEEDIGKIATAFKTLHTADREDSGKADATLQNFWAILKAERSVPDSIDAEYEDMGGE